MAHSAVRRMWSDLAQRRPAIRRVRTLEGVIDFGLDDAGGGGGLLDEHDEDDDEDGGSSDGIVVGGGGRSGGGGADNDDDDELFMFQGGGPPMLQRSRTEMPSQSPRLPLGLAPARVGSQPSSPVGGGAGGRVGRFGGSTPRSRHGSPAVAPVQLRRQHSI